MTETRRLLGVMVALSTIAIVFAAGVVAVVLVQDNDHNAANPVTELVANALDLESEADSETSERQTESALTDEHLAYADDLVEEGTITEEQAEELLNWWAQAPEWVGSIQRSDEWEDLEYTFRFAPFAEFRGDSDSDERFGWSDEFEFEGLLPEDFADRLEDWLSELEDDSQQDEQDESEHERRFWFGRRSFDESPDNFGWSDGSRGAEWLDELFEEGLMEDGEFTDWLEGMMEDLEMEFDGEWGGIPGERQFEFDSDDGRFRFRGEWRYGDGGGDALDEDEDKDEKRYRLVPRRGISF